MNKTQFIIAVGFIFLAAGILQNCVQPPDYPDEPVIEFMSLSKTTMRQTPLGTDSILITFSFTDGDGDLGTVNGEPNIFIKDGRDGFDKPPYQIPYIEPQGAGNGISGEITVVVPTTCCIYTDVNGFKYSCETVPVPFDTLTFLIWINDQAGHESNRIETPPIGLICK